MIKMTHADIQNQNKMKFVSLIEMKFASLIEINLHCCRIFVFLMEAQS